MLLVLGSAAVVNPSVIGFADVVFASVDATAAFVDDAVVAVVVECSNSHVSCNGEFSFVLGEGAIAAVADAFAVAVAVVASSVVVRAVGGAVAAPRQPIKTHIE